MLCAVRAEPPAFRFGLRREVEVSGKAGGLFHAGRERWACGVRLDGREQLLLEYHEGEGTLALCHRARAGGGAVSRWRYGISRRERGRLSSVTSEGRKNAVGLRRRDWFRGDAAPVLRGQDQLRRVGATSLCAHPATFRAACECIRFGLSDGDALRLLGEWNATHCQPPWTEKDLAYKLADAHRAAGGERREVRQDKPTVRVVWKIERKPPATPQPAAPQPPRLWPIRPGEPIPAQVVDVLRKWAAFRSHPAWKGHPQLQ